MPEILKPEKKLDPPTPSGNRPPPLPGARVAAKSRATDRVKAFLAIRRMRLADRVRRLRGWARRRPALAAVAGVAILAAASAGAYVAVEGLPDLELFSPPTVANARANASSHPNDATARRDLGHAQWDAKRRRAAIASYARALALDREVADDRMAQNLAAAFGTRDQRRAEPLIWKYGLVGAQPRLEALVRSKRHAVRWGAVHTLDRLGKGTRGNWETAYILDLDSPQCELRRTAVEKLGAIGTRRAITALRGAREDDEKTGGWFRSRCLGERLDTAEKQILARR